MRLFKIIFCKESCPVAGVSCESSGGSRRLAKINKAPSPSSGSTSSTGSSGGKDKVKKVTDDMAENGSKHNPSAKKKMSCGALLLQK